MAPTLVHEKTLQTVTVPDGAVDAYLRSGWRRPGTPPAPPKRARRPQDAPETPADDSPGDDSAVDDASSTPGEAS